MQYLLGGKGTRQGDIPRIVGARIVAKRGRKLPEKVPDPLEKRQAGRPKRLDPR